MSDMSDMSEMNGKNGKGQHGKGQNIINGINGQSGDQLGLQGHNISPSLILDPVDPPVYGGGPGGIDLVERRKYTDWVKRAVRPVFRDLEVGEYEGDNRKQFDIDSPFLPLLNPRIRDGTLHNAGNMNNMFYFHNLLAMRGTRYSVSGLGTNEIIEIISEKIAEPDEPPEDVPPIGRPPRPIVWYRTIARTISRLEQTDPAVWRITESLFDVNALGENALVQSREIVYRQHVGTTILGMPTVWWEAEVN